MGADLLAILANSGSSLGAHQAAAATASQNIANVNTPGYARQTANLESLTPAQLIAGAFIGRGVGVQSVTQARDRFLERQLPSAIASKASSSAESDALAAVSALDPDAAGGLGAALGNFYASLRGVAQNPSDLSQRQVAVTAAQQLGAAFNRTAAALEDARTGLDSKIDGTVAEANDDAAAMASLNTQIRAARANGAEPNDLLDARQRLQDKLTQLTGATPVTNSKGDVSMALPGGAALVGEDRAATLSTIADPANGGHLALRLTRADGSGPIALPSSAAGGTLGGAVSARDAAIGGAETRLDSLAFDLANATNAVQSAGFALDGTTGHALFTVGATSAGAATQLTVDANLAADPSLLAAASSAAGLPGDSTNMLALIATERTALAGGSDPATTLQNLVSSFGGDARTAKAFADQDSAIL